MGKTKTLEKLSKALGKQEVLLICSPRYVAELNIEIASIKSPFTGIGIKPNEKLLKKGISTVSINGTTIHFTDNHDIINQ